MCNLSNICNMSWMCNMSNHLSVSWMFNLCNPLYVTLEYQEAHVWVCRDHVGVSACAILFTSLLDGYQEASSLSLSSSSGCLTVILQNVWHVLSSASTSIICRRHWESVSSLRVCVIIESLCHHWECVWKHQLWDARLSLLVACILVVVLCMLWSSELTRSNWKQSVGGHAVDPPNYLSPNSSMPPAPLRLQVCCRVWCGVVRVLQCEGVLQCGKYLSPSSVMPLFNKKPKN